MINFRIFSIDELCDFINGFGFKSGDYVQKAVDTVEVFRMGYIARDGGFKEDSTPVFIPKNYRKNLSKYYLRSDDVLIAMTDMKNNVAILANTARIKETNRFVLNQRVGCIRVKRQDILDSTFFYFYSNWKPHIEYLRSRANSGVQVNLSTSAIKEAKISIPSLSEQKAIASVLGALDDKIENNRRMNETLEEMARAIFKSWFVDFDPVHAKAAGNSPAHMDAETAALFPSTFADDGLPEGWVEKALRDFKVEIESGRRPKGGIDKSLKDGIPSIGAESILKIGEFDYSKSKYVRPEFAETSTNGWVKNYDVAIYKDGANVGDPTRVSLFGDGFPFDKFMINEHVFLIRNTEIGQPFLYSLFQTKSLSLQLHSMGNSKAAQPGINQQEVLSCNFFAPRTELFSVFNKTVMPLIHKRLAIGKENQTLVELRDTLLPKLMSGEVRVRDAERELEATV